MVQNHFRLDKTKEIALIHNHIFFRCVDRLVKPAIGDNPLWQQPQQLSSTMAGSVRATTSTSQYAHKSHIDK